MTSSIDRQRREVALVSLDKDLLDLLLDLPDLSVKGIFDPKFIGGLRGVPPLGSDDAWPSARVANPKLKAVLGVDSPSARKRLTMHYGIENLLSIRAPCAQVSPHARIGEGTIVHRWVLVSMDVEVGQACKLNVGASIHHDCSVGDYSTLAPGARLLGSVHVGARVYVGSHAVILPGLSIGDGAMIGAGAVVVRDVPAGATITGVPGRARQ